MRFRFLLWFLGLSLIVSTGIYQTGLADAGEPHKIYLPVALSGPASGTTFPNESDFIQSVINQNPDQVSGVYVASVLAKPVVQQPEGNYGFISNDSKVVTLYSLAAMQGVTGLLAHNGLAGTQFFDLRIGQRVSIVYGNGMVHPYRISQIQRYQALDPLNYASDFIDQSNGERLSAAELFARVYLGGDHVTFQTCISQNGNPSWGRLFVIAEPE
jgi:hypothetical protein